MPATVLNVDEGIERELKCTLQDEKKYSVINIQYWKWKNWKWAAVIGKKFYTVANHRVHQGEGYNQALSSHPM